MTNIELYINQQLCDIQNPESLGIRLNRVLINPAELSTKDAQYSYSITIPSTSTNDAIFSFVNVEEVKNKFNTYHNAQLYVDGILIFDGRFKLSEIDTEGNYKGNLVVPAKKTIKEIFGDKKMNEMGQWKLMMKDIVGVENEEELIFTDFLSAMNKRTNSEAIFPLVFYGLLPKQPMLQYQDGSYQYSGKTLLDKYLRLGINNFPPSINCLQAIQKIFTSLKDDTGKPINITGSAFSDQRLSKLYMSYKNPIEYEQPWNWGQFAKMRLTGKWTNIKNDNKTVFEDHVETMIYANTGDFEQIAVNLFDSKNAEVVIEKDTGNNIMQVEVLGGNEKRSKTTTDVVIPASGLYKITFKARLAIIDGKNGKDGKYGGSSHWFEDVRFAYNNSYNTSNLFGNIRHELKVLRSLGEDNYNMSGSVIDGVYFKNNQKLDIGDDDYNTSINQEYKFKNYPLYFPNINDDSVLFVDPAQNANFVCGFRWGANDERFRHNPLKEGEQGIFSVLAAKHGYSSWNNATKEYTYCAVNNPQGYQKFGDIETIIPDPETETDPAIDPKSETDSPKIKLDTGYQQTEKYRIDLKHALNFARKISKPTDADPIFDNANGSAFGEGEVNVIIWLEKGEKLTVVDVADKGVFRAGKGHHSGRAYIKHAVTFDLDIKPFSSDKEWIKINMEGTGTQEMDWNDSTDNKFGDSAIDLIKFLPSDIKIDSWLDNFCRAFNLQLAQTDEGKFELNVKPINAVSAVDSVLDLDSKTCITKASNQPLGLPSEYKLGFKIEKEEEGYVKSLISMGHYEDGGGSLKTGDIDGKPLEQNSDFSYNWYKSIKKEEGETPEIELSIPVISHKDVWFVTEYNRDYAEMQKKLYTNYAQRFWYHSGINDNLGEIWKTVGKDSTKKTELYLPRLSNTLSSGDAFHLDYHEEYNSILTSYFNIIASNDSNYTYVECLLTPDEYDQLDGSKLVKLNSDLYFVAAVEGYDPLGRNKTKLKLIRKV